jgi:hypothetical protein
MANEEHVEILRQGVEAWNKWRKENPLAEPDLRRTNLAGISLVHANLSHANLNNANLHRADLSHAELEGSILYRVNLSGADLRSAKLMGAKLWMANLEEANIDGSSFTGASFIRARFRHCSLRNIRFAPEHPSLTDGSDTIVLHWRDKYLNWAWLRAIGRFPLFGVSWELLGTVTKLWVGTVADSSIPSATPTRELQKEYLLSERQSAGLSTSLRPDIRQTSPRS